MQPCKVALSPAQNTIIRLLEEAGEEDMRTVRASIQIGGEELAREIAALETLGFVQGSIAFGWPALLLTAKGRAAIST